MDQNTAGDDDDLEPSANPEGTNQILATWVALGLVMGAGLGVVLGLLLPGDNFVFGIPIGFGLGLVLGTAIGVNRSRS